MSSKLTYDKSKFVSKPYPGDAEGSFVLGTQSDTLQTVLLKSETPQELLGCVWFGLKTAGPPNHVHGGCQAALLDEMMGSTAWHFGHSVVAAKIEVQFLAMVPYEKQYSMRGRIVDVNRRKVSVQAELFDDTKVYAKSSGLFVILTEDHMKKLNI